MKKTIVFLGTVLAIFFLTSCSYTQSVVPKAFPGSAELFKVNNAGTVEVKGYSNKEQPMHWVFVECENHVRGCYMRCQGPKNICQSIAAKSGLKNEYVLKRSPGETQFLGIWKILDFSSN
tara:strand:+ start:2432 stop:2791 length:360 start_codon:yes stop_codon:yes gene_type:complete